MRDDVLGKPCGTLHRRAVASRVGAALVDGRKMRATADDRGQKCRLEKIVKKKQKNLKVIIRITYGIDAFARTMYGTVPYIAKYRKEFCLLLRKGDPTITRFKD